MAHVRNSTVVTKLIDVADVSPIDALGMVERDEVFDMSAKE